MKCALVWCLLPGDYTVLFTLVQWGELLLILLEICHIFHQISTVGELHKWVYLVSVVFLLLFFFQMKKNQKYVSSCNIICVWNFIWSISHMQVPSCNFQQKYYTEPPSFFVVVCLGGCTITFFQLLHIDPRKAGFLFPLLLCSLWCVQIIGVMAGKTTISTSVMILDWVL